MGLRQDPLRYVQYFAVDETRVVRTGEPKLGGLSRPTTPGDWGQWTIGGQKMYCQEKQRLLDQQYAQFGNKGKCPKETVSFCKEPIRDITFKEHQELGNRKDQNKAWHWPEWRKCDGASVQCL